MSNFESDSAKQLQIVLTGQPELRDVLNQPELRQLKQRVALRCEIKPLPDIEETARYIASRLLAAGAERTDVFTPGAVDLIFRCSEGIPRQINNICDNSHARGLRRGRADHRARHRRRGRRDLRPSAERAARAAVGRGARGRGAHLHRRRALRALGGRGRGRRARGKRRSAAAAVAERRGARRAGEPRARGRARAGGRCGGRTRARHATSWAAPSAVGTTPREIRDGQSLRSTEEARGRAERPERRAPGQRSRGRRGEGALPLRRAERQRARATGTRRPKPEHAPEYLFSASRHFQSPETAQSSASTEHTGTPGGSALPAGQASRAAGATLGAAGSARTPEFVSIDISAARVEPHLVAVTQPRSSHAERFRSLAHARAPRGRAPQDAGVRHHERGRDGGEDADRAQPLLAARADRRRLGAAHRRRSAQPVLRPNTSASTRPPGLSEVLGGRGDARRGHRPA